MAEFVVSKAEAAVFFCDIFHCLTMIARDRNRGVADGAKLRRGVGIQVGPFITLVVLWTGNGPQNVGFIGDGHVLARLMPKLDLT